MKLKLVESGFTFIEAILAMTILAAAFVALSLVLTETTDRNIGLEASNVSLLLAREKMSETTVKEFAAITDTSLTNFGGDFGQYGHQVSVDYVESSNLDAPVAGPTDYKRIVVSVTGLGKTVRLYALKVNI